MSWSLSAGMVMGENHAGGCAVDGGEPKVGALSRDVVLCNKAGM